MMADLDLETRRLVEITVAAAPPLTSDQIAELRQVFKPEHWRTEPMTVKPLTQALKRAA